MIQTERKDRNMVIYQLFTQGISAYEIATKFALTPPRVYQIVKRMQEKQKGKSV